MSAPDQIYVGGTVVTVDADASTAEAVAVSDSVITAVGSEAEVRALAGDDTEVVELDGKALLPAFLDPHSHVTVGAQYIKHAAVLAPPIGDTRTVADVIRKLHESKERNNPAPGEYVIGWGFFPEAMDDGGELTAEMLDAEFPDHKVAIVHISAHGGLVNTAVLDEMGFHDGVANPDGGTIVRYPGTEKPTGMLWETAWMEMLFSLFSGEDEDALGQMMAEYNKFGITVAQDGAASVEDTMRLRAYAEKHEMPVDVKSLIIFNELQDALDKGILNTEIPGHKVQGTKLIIDGSPQGKTAYVTEEYLTGGPSGEQHWHGVQNIPDDIVNQTVELAYRHGVQVYAHCNGDGAIDTLLGAHRYAVAAGNAGPGRTVPIHSQVMRQDQLDAYIEADFAPSMFTVHTYFFGDVHLKNFGEERANGISPLNSASARNLHPTNHSDYPVTPLNPLLILWSSVVRRSTGGVVLGEHERVSVDEGLRALTYNVAYEYGLEDTLGSIEVGKRADLVILTADPRAVEPDEIRDIAVVRTVKEGRTVYAA